MLILPQTFIAFEFEKSQRARALLDSKKLGAVVGESVLVQAGNRKAPAHLAKRTPRYEQRPKEEDGVHRFDSVRVTPGEPGVGGGDERYQG